MDLILCVLYPLKDLSILAGLICVLNILFLTNPRNRKIRYFIAAAAICAVDIFGVLHPSDFTTQQYEFLDAVSFLMYIAAAFFLIRKPPTLKTIITIFIYVATAEMLWSFAGSFLPFESTTTEAMISECVFNTVFGLAIFSAVLIIERKGYAPLFSYSAAKFPRSIFCCLFLFELAFYYREFGLSDAIYNALFGVSGCLIVGCLFYMFFNIQNLHKSQEETFLRLSEQLDFTEKSKYSDEELRAFRHDIKNHFIVLNSLFSKGEYEKAAQYVDSLCQNAEPFLSRYSTGNAVADSLLTVKSKHFPIDFDGVIPEGFVPAEDICIILGNLLDNAVAACYKVDSENPRIIKIRSWIKNGNFVIKISNPVSDYQDKKKKYHKLETTKDDKKNHGYGLANIRRSVEKNNGTLELYSEKGRFTAEVILNGGNLK